MGLRDNFEALKNFPHPLRAAYAGRARLKSRFQPIASALFPSPDPTREGVTSQRAPGPENGVAAPPESVWCEATRQGTPFCLPALA